MSGSSATGTVRVDTNNNYLEVGQVTVKVDIFDGEDTITAEAPIRISVLDFFQDSDGDLYGDRENYEVSCPTSSISHSLITFGLKQGSSEYQGIDCLDDGELVDTVKVGALAEVQSLPASVSVLV